MVQDYFKILGVSQDASLKEIKQAYHMLALKAHPDKNPAAFESNQRFAEINCAYETLKDSKKKAAYLDQYNESTKEFETLTEIIIYVTIEGIAYLISRAKELVISASRKLASKAKYQALEGYEKIKEKGAEVFKKLKHQASEKYQDAKVLGAEFLDQAASKAHSKYEGYRDNSAKAFDDLKAALKAKFLDVQITSSEVPDVPNEELHSPMNNAPEIPNEN